MKRLIFGLLFAILGVSSAFAACPAGTYFTTNGNNCIFVSPDNPLPVTGSGGGSVTQGTSPWIGAEVQKTLSRFKVAASDNHQTLQTGAGVITDLLIGSNATLSGTFNYIRLYDSGAGFNGCGSATNIKFSMPFTSPGLALRGLGIAFASGIAVCVTGADGDTDTTAATASATTVTVLNR